MGFTYGSQRELAERGVVLAVNTLTLEHRELDCLLVIGDGGESPLWKKDELGQGVPSCHENAREETRIQMTPHSHLATAARDSVATRDDRTRINVALHGDTERERADIEQEHVSGLGRGSLAGKDTSLDSSAVGDGLVRVDALLELLAVEEVGKELLDTGNTSRTTDKHDVVNLALLDLRVLQDLLNRLDGALEGLAVDLLETGTGNVGVEVLAVEERVDFDGGLGAVRKGTLRTLASSSQTTEGPGIASDQGRSPGWPAKEHIPFLVFFWNSFLKCSRRLVSKS
ncbi:Heat shock protein [Hortaea werneckii]|nr:Heat shock protein [Hortaea werneckii]KAI7360278.1 Heat shock protein [Hortaea werneckii]